MRCLAVFGAVLWIACLISLSSAIAHADEVASAPPAAMVVDPSCRLAAVASERRWGVPDGLLSAIGRMESGRADPSTRRIAAWAWTINVQGQDYVFENPAQAVDAVRMQLMRGIRSIDVGCFQVNLLYHPDAFVSLEQGFDPDANADYAGRFLAELHARLGSWERAVAWYHSATPGVGEAYRDRVLTDWSGGGLRIMPLTEPSPEARLALSASSRVETGLRDPYLVVAMAPWGGVRVWLPGAATGLHQAVAISGRLPRVVTPHG